MGMSEKKRKRGRPRLAPEEKFAARHVIGLTAAMDEATKKFCRDNGIARQADGLRQLIVRSLRVDGYL